MNRKDGQDVLLDLGLQPISNRYIQRPDEPEELFQLRLGQCRTTGLIKLVGPVPQKELVPRFEWITYSEPEEHLDALVEKLYKSSIKKENPVIGGISFKDDSTLDRFETWGCKTWRIDSQNDLSVNFNVGVESVQASLSPEIAKSISKKYGKADLLVVRHIWEHVYDQAKFSRALKELTASDGLILFEVPDCTNLIENFDHTMPWEEHLYYYSPFTFRSSLRNYGFELVDLEVFSYPYENSLVALARVSTPGNFEESLDQHQLEKALTSADTYASTFPLQSKAIAESIKIQSKGEKVIIFGAGHSSGAFINHYNLQDNVECVVDDDRNKWGLFMPKSRIPIRNSTILQEVDLKLCLLAVNPIHEDTIILKHKKYLEGGGKFRSIFPLNKF